jgi:hypothetical protein
MSPPAAASLTGEELQSIALAYRALTRYGQATATPAPDGPQWDWLIDEAQQKLGVVLAMALAGRITVDGGRAPVEAALAIAWPAA